MSPTVVLLNISPWGDGGLLPGIGRDVNCLGYICQGFNCPGRSYAVTALQATDQMPSDEVVGLPGIRWFPDKKRWNRSKYGHSMAVMALMPSVPDTLPELVIVSETDAAAARRARRLAAEGRLRRIYPSIYTSNLGS